MNKYKIVLLVLLISVLALSTQSAQASNNQSSITVKHLLTDGTEMASPQTYYGNENDQLHLVLDAIPGYMILGGKTKVFTFQASDSVEIVTYRFKGLGLTSHSTIMFETFNNITVNGYNATGDLVYYPYNDQDFIRMNYSINIRALDSGQINYDIYLPTDNKQFLKTIPELIFSVSGTQTATKFYSLVEMSDFGYEFKLSYVLDDGTIIEDNISLSELESVVRIHLNVKVAENRISLIGNRTPYDYLDINIVSEIGLHNNLLSEDELNGVIPLGGWKHLRWLEDNSDTPNSSLVNIYRSNPVYHGEVRSVNNARPFWSGADPLVGSKVVLYETNNPTKVVGEVITDANGKFTFKDINSFEPLSIRINTFGGDLFHFLYNGNFYYVKQVDIGSTVGLDVETQHFPTVVWNAPYTFLLDKLPIRLIIMYDPPIFFNYRVDFDSRGGSTVSSIENIFPMSLISSPNNPQRKGYRFVAWYTSDRYDQIWNFQSDKVDKNTTLYALWEPIPDKPEKEIVEKTKVKETKKEDTDAKTLPATGQEESHEILLALVLTLLGCGILAFKLRRKMNS